MDSALVMRRNPVNVKLALLAIAVLSAVVWSSHAMTKHAESASAINNCNPGQKALTLTNALTKFEVCKLDQNTWGIVVNDGMTGWTAKLSRVVNYLKNQKISGVSVENKALADEFAEAWALFAKP